MQANDVAKALKSWLAIYITEKEYANEPQKYQTGGRTHTDDPVCGLPGSLSERKKRSAKEM